MTNTELEKRQERAANEALVIAEVEGGFRVYAAVEPKRAYLVTGVPATPQCTCKDFELHGTDPGWRCKHILAVLDRFFAGNGATGPDKSDAEERQAIQEESRPKRSKKLTSVPPTNGAAQMLLKRSMSPDGRIDSLSVEFSCAVDAVPSADIKVRAKQMLGLQAAILADFMCEQPPRNGNGVGKPTNDTSNGASQHNGSAGNGPSQGNVPQPTARVSNGSVPARLAAIGGMDGKWGRRLFIVVEINGQNTRLFGNRKQLGDALIAAGYTTLAANVAEGVSLNLPCRVITKPSDDGRFLNVTQVLPANGVQP